MFQRLKKRNKVFKKWHILENLQRQTKFRAKSAWAGVGGWGGAKVNISI